MKTIVLSLVVLFSSLCAGGSATAQEPYSAELVGVRSANVGVVLTVDMSQMFVAPFRVIGIALKEDTLTRLGNEAETLANVKSQCEAAEKNPKYGYGISTRLNSKKKGKTVSKSDVEKHFTVKQTGDNKSHYTVFFEKPVTQAQVDKFNELFKPYKIEDDTTVPPRPTEVDDDVPTCGPVFQNN